jgi:hypothetical protein
MRQLRDELDLAEKHKQECMDKMLHICKTYYPEELRRLMTIPGIGEHSWQYIPAKDHHRVCLGSQPDQGLLLQPILLPSDTSSQEEQDEGSRGGGAQTAHSHMACASRRDRLQGLQELLFLSVEECL